MQGVIRTADTFFSPGWHSSHSRILSSPGWPKGHSHYASVIASHVLGGALIHAYCTHPVTKRAPIDVYMQCCKWSQLLHSLIYKAWGERAWTCHLGQFALSTQSSKALCRFFNTSLKASMSDPLCTLPRVVLLWIATSIFFKQPIKVKVTGKFAQMLADS